MVFIGVILVCPIKANNIPSYPTISESVYLQPRAPHYVLDGQVLASKVFLKDKQMYYTIKCESNFRADALNENDPTTPSYGIAQFKEQTFNLYCVKRYNVASSTDEIMNANTQIECMEKMFNDGLQGHWTCWRKLYK